MWESKLHGVHFEKDLSRFSDYNRDFFKGKNVCILRTTFRNDVRKYSSSWGDTRMRWYGSDDETSDESEGDISDMSEESEEDLDEFRLI